MLDYRRETEVTPRGIAPDLLIRQVQNTVPFLFEPGFEPPQSAPHLTLLQTVARESRSFEDFDLPSYFELCLSAHHGTVASFVPTDVDNHIRFKLWSPGTAEGTIARMVDHVEKSRHWDFRPVSCRFVTSPESGERMSGHNGEWFSTAVAAYGATRRRATERALSIQGLILHEIEREAKIYLDFRKHRHGIGCLKAATILAHNLGDLDRVIELWNLEADSFYQPHKVLSGVTDALWEAREMNKALMAIENHRHFALRVPRCLRRSADFLLPIAPFLDDWGASIATHPDLRPEEIGEIAEALVDGWEKLAEPVGYARALSGIEENFRGGLSQLAQNMPARNARKLKTGGLRTLVAVPKSRFEGYWNQAALKWLRDITPCK